MVRPTALSCGGGQYELIRGLGEGGMAAVYLARDLRLGRLVAIKFLHPHLCRDPSVVRRFEIEARAASLRADGGA